MKTIGQRVNIVAQAHEVIVHGRTLGGKRRSEDALDTGRVDGKARQALRDIVVQFAGKPSALVLVYREQAPAERRSIRPRRDDAGRAVQEAP